MLEINFVNTSCLPASGVSAALSLTVRLSKSIIAFATPWSDPLNKGLLSISLFFGNAISNRLPSVYLYINLSFVKLFHTFINSHSIDTS